MLWLEGGPISALRRDCPLLSFLHVCVLGPGAPVLPPRPAARALLRDSEGRRGDPAPRGGVRLQGLRRDSELADGGARVAHWPAGGSGSERP